MKYEHQDYSIQSNSIISNFSFPCRTFNNKGIEFDMLKDIKQNKLSMRKNKLMIYFNQRRKINNAYGVENEIKPSCLNLTEEMKSIILNDINDKNQMEKIMIMLSSSNINLRNYMIYLLRNYFANNTLIDLTIVNEFNLIQLLTDILLIDKSINVQNEIYWIFINYSYFYSNSNGDRNHLNIFSSKDKVNLYKESLLIESINDELKATILQFLINISFNNDDCRQVIYEEGIFDLLVNNKEFSLNSLWLLGILVKKQMNINEKHLLRVYEIFFDKLIHSSDINSIICCLYALVTISNYSQSPLFDFSNMIKKDHLIDYIINYDYKSDENDKNINEDYNSNIIILKYSLQIITNSLINEQCNMSEYFISIHLFDFLLKNLQLFNIPIITIEILAILHNISVGSMNDIISLISHEIFQSIISYITNPNITLRLKSASIICNTLHYLTYDISKLIYSSTLKNILIKTLSNETNQEVISISLTIILQFLLSDEHTSTPLHNAFQLSNLEDIIDKYLLSDDQDLKLITITIIKHLKNI